jgi:transketolase
MCIACGLTLSGRCGLHQILEDIGLMKMLPHMVVINPCDYNQTNTATIAIANYDTAVYCCFEDQQCQTLQQPTNI